MGARWLLTSPKITCINVSKCLIHARVVASSWIPVRLPVRVRFGQRAFRRHNQLAIAWLAFQGDRL